jgi:drug/metabolite transporter (DMT)-like permease
VDPGVSLDYVTTVLAALLVGTGFVLQQRAAAMAPASRFPSIRLIIDLVRKPRWLAGVGLLAGGDILAAWSIGHLELSLVEPLLTTYLIVALVLAVPLSGHAFRLREVIGAVILVTGVALLSASRSARPAGLSVGSVSHWPAAAGIAALAVILVEAGRRRPGRLRAALTGTAAGLVLGIQDALTRQTLEALQGNPFTVLFSTWPAYALAGAGALGIWLTQNAFSAGPLQASLPAISAGEPLTGILLGVIVFGDRIQISPGLLAIQAGGVAALVAGVVTVASDPALSQLREQASTLRSAVRDTASHATLRSQPGRSGADAAAGGPPGDATSSDASPEGAAGNPAPGGVVPSGLPDGDMQGGTARGGVNSRTAPGGVNSRCAGQPRRGRPERRDGRGRVTGRVGPRA